MTLTNTAAAKPGRLVRFRGRRCIVQPSPEKDLILLKPLGGSDDEMIGVYEPVLPPGERIEEDVFELPGTGDLDSFISAKLLYDAARLSFRQVSGPFRSMGKLSFRPRAYQLVPLIMGLRQQVTRLLIADDVGIGKTIEGLLIIRELLERGIITSFAVLCPPHLCEQWQKELGDKLGIEAEIIRSSTVAALERRIVGDDTQNVFSYYPYQVISIDYVKSDNKKPVFLKDAPSCIIVDEAHTCARPQNQRDNQQQRFHLLKDLSINSGRHLIMLTATPHSGKDAEFQSLLELIDPRFAGYDLSTLSNDQKRELAGHFIQRKRGNILRWLEEETIFPKRSTEELAYTLTPPYRELYDQVLKFARGISGAGMQESRARIRYFAALTLLRGVMSSPDAGYEMLRKRREKSEPQDAPSTASPLTANGEENGMVENGMVENGIEENPVIEKWDEGSDTEQGELIEGAHLSDSEWNALARLAAKAEELRGTAHDKKLLVAANQIKRWIANNQSPIIFCRFIATAKYVAEQLKDLLPQHTDIRAITSELSDEERREKIDEMGKSPKRVLVATDCLSEGINLQEHFNAILHYDLPWNPNRLEQREGRVDRFGQAGFTDRNGKAQNIVEVRVLFGEDNPIDVVVLRIILEKIQRIQNTSGVSISLADDNRSVMDKVLKEVLLNPERTAAKYSPQLQLDFGPSPEMDLLDAEITREIEAARDKAEKIRSIFAHDAIRPEEVQNDLKEVDEAIGDTESLRAFVLHACTLFNAQYEEAPGGYILHRHNMEPWLYSLLGTGDHIRISFLSPTPQGFRYLGRNHPFVERLCHRILLVSLEKEHHTGRAARASVFLTRAVSEVTTLVQFRVRNVIRELGTAQETIAEEMYLWGYTRTAGKVNPLPADSCKALLRLDDPKDLSKEQQIIRFTREMEQFSQMEKDFMQIVQDRADALVAAHTRFAKYLGARQYQAVVPVLPPDVLGVYVLVPEVRR